ncbi:SRPBCC domain-containing protein [Streptomyces sp. NPDC001857]|uniref:SRPBCC domain-containing protein n=1 Tax=unclassified Streptomyces TaxID=2593676 RepID=UPI00332E9892
MSGSIEQGTSQTHGDIRILHFLVRLPRTMEAVWPAFTTPDGLAQWFGPVDVLEPRYGGVIGLPGLGGGQVTAWDVDRVAEYTVEGGGRMRFHLERDGERGCALRFTYEFQGDRDDDEDDAGDTAPAAEPEGGSEHGWRARFERLIEHIERVP